jgi:MFS family permease
VALFMASKFGSLTVEYIGIGTAVCFLVRGITQIPIGTVTDKIKSDRDEILLLVLGCFLMAIPYLFYPWVTQPWHYYILQGIFGLGASLNLNNWRKLFAKNLDHNREGFEYGFYETIMSISTAFFGLMSGFASSISPQVFEIVIMSIGLLTMLGGIAAAGVYRVSHRKSATIS